MIPKQIAPLTIWRLCAAGLSALLMVSAFPGNSAPLAVWVCLIPWLLAIKNCPPSPAGRPSLVPVLLSLVFSGLVFMVYLWRPFYQAASTIAPNAPAAGALTTAHFLTCMLPFVVMGGLHCRFDNHSILAAASLASWFTIATSLTPALFVFNLGTLLYEHPVFLQLVDLSGTSLLLWCIVLANIIGRNILVELWHARSQGRRPLAPALQHNLVALAGLLVLVFGYGTLRLNQAPPQNSERLRIASIQPNLGARIHPKAMVRDNKQGDAFSPVELTRKALNEHPRPDLIVWPENALPIPCNDPVVERKISDLAAELAIPIMHQCVDCASTIEKGDCFNQSRYVDEQGITRFHHNKRNLVPFFEQMPAWLPTSLLRWSFPTDETSLINGGQSSLFEHKKARIIPAICFDAQSPELLRSGLDRGGQVLINQSNDRIFKDSKIGLYDLAINIVDAVAMRVPMVKVSNSGYGAFLQAEGRLVPGSITPVYQKTVSVFELTPQPGTSLYRRFGNWFVYLAGILAGVGLLASRRRDAA